jgi:WD40 repeat protein
MRLSLKRESHPSNVAGGTDKKKGKSFLATSSQDRTVKLWDPDTGDLLGSLEELESVVGTLCFSPDGSKLAGGCANGNVIFWDMRKREIEAELGGHDDIICDVCFNATSDKLASASFDKSVIIWDVKVFLPIKTLRGHIAAVTSVVFVGDRTLISSSYDTVMCVWQYQRTVEGNEGQTPNLTVGGWPDGIQQVAKHPLEDKIAISCLDGNLYEWDMLTHDKRMLGQRVMPYEYCGKPYDMCYSPNGRLLATWNLATPEVQIRDSYTGQIQSSFITNGPIVSAAFDGSGKALLVGGAGAGVHTISVFDINTGQELYEFGSHEDAFLCVCSSPAVAASHVEKGSHKTHKG